MTFVPIKCPFCGEDDFDRIGLRGHLKNGWCEEFDKHEIDTADEPETRLPAGCFSEDDLDLDGSGI